MRLLLEGAVPADLRTGTGSTALIASVTQGHMGCMHALLEWHADPNATDATGQTACMHASSNGHHSSLLALCEANEH